MSNALGLVKRCVMQYNAAPMRKATLELPFGVTTETARAFFRLYEFEVWLRDLIYLELKAYYGPEWWKEVESAFRHRGGLRFDRSFKSDKRHAHMSTPENDPLWFISFEVLLKILFAPKFWNRFKTYLTTKSLLREKFTEVASVRNRVAHCRKLHPFDVSRIESLMRDLDDGFWRFCTSYNSQLYPSENDPLLQWTKSRLAPTSIDVNIFLSTRPSVPKSRSRKLGPGWFYHLIFVQNNRGRYMNYPEILRSTKRHHRNVLHVILESHQQSLEVTVPAVVAFESITSLVESFVSATGNCYSLAPLVGQSKEYSWKEYLAQMDPFERMAAEWPHYVLPPTHPFGFLDRSCPCNFFEVFSDSK